MRTGADALSVSFSMCSLSKPPLTSTIAQIALNSVGMVFLVEIDTALYTFGFQERLRARVEQHGRVTLSQQELRDMMWDKIFHVPIIALGILHYLGSINGLRPKDEAGTNFVISWRMHFYWWIFWVAGLLSGTSSLF